MLDGTPWSEFRPETLKYLKNEGGITLQKMIFLKKKNFDYFLVAEYKPVCKI